MQHYKNKPEDFKLFRKTVLAKTIPLMLFAVIAGLTISYYTQGGNEDGAQSVIAYTTMITVVIGYSVFRGIKRQQEMFGTYEFTVAGDCFLLKQSGIADKKLLFSDVEAIKQGKNGYLTIYGAGKADRIFVSPYLQNYDELKTFFGTVRPVTIDDSKSLLQKYSYVPALGAIALMGAVYVSENKIVVGVSGLLLTALLLWGFYTIRKSDFVDEQAKRNAWWGLLVLVSIIAITLYKVFGGAAQ